LVTEKGEESRRQNLLAGYLSILFAAVLFGSVFSLAKVPLDTIDPLVLTAVVYTISGIALIPFARASFTFESKDDYFYVILVTIFGGILAPVLLMYGLQQTAASSAAILSNAEVVFTILLSSIFFGERPHGKIGLFAVVLVVIGLFLATTEDLDALETIIQLNPGNIMILASMFVWAVDNNLSRRLTVRVSPAKIAMVKSLGGGLVLVAIALFMGKGNIITAIEFEMWILIAGMSVAGFGGALLLFLEGIKRIGTVRTMSMFSLTPVFGIVIAALTLGETITVFQGIATGLIIAGIIMVGRH
jgi:drug/metabolite transporter (DMT)-like permease